MQNLSPKLLQALINAANNSLANSTWKQYKTAQKHLERCQRETGVRMSFPMSTKQILVFIAYMLETRKVQSVTVSKTLSALRTLHLIEGINEHSLRPDVVKSILKGQANWDEEKKRNTTNVRLPVTINVLKLLKVQLRRSKLSEKRCALIWAVSLLAFHGCFRIGRCFHPENLIIF